MPQKHTLTPAQYERVQALWSQRQRIDEMMQFFLSYVAVEAGLPVGTLYNLSADLRTLVAADPVGATGGNTTDVV